MNCSKTDPGAAGRVVGTSWISSTLNIWVISVVKLAMTILLPSDCTFT